MSIVDMVDCDGLLSEFIQIFCQPLLVLDIKLNIVIFKKQKSKYKFICFAYIHYAPSSPTFLLQKNCLDLIKEYKASVKDLLADTATDTEIFHQISQLIDAYNMVGRFYLLEKKFEKAKFLINKGILMYDNINDNLIITNETSILNKLMGQFLLALAHFSEGRPKIAAQVLLNHKSFTNFLFPALNKNSTLFCVAYFLLISFLFTLLKDDIQVLTHCDMASKYLTAGFKLNQFLTLKNFMIEFQDLKNNQIYKLTNSEWYQLRYYLCLCEYFRIKAHDFIDDDKNAMIFQVRSTTLSGAYLPSASVLNKIILIEDKLHKRTRLEKLKSCLPESYLEILNSKNYEKKVFKFKDRIVKKNESFGVKKIPVVKSMYLRAGTSHIRGSGNIPFATNETEASQKNKILTNTSQTTYYLQNTFSSFTNSFEKKNTSSTSNLKKSLKETDFLLMQDYLNKTTDRITIGSMTMPKHKSGHKTLSSTEKELIQNLKNPDKFRYIKKNNVHQMLLKRITSGNKINLNDNHTVNTTQNIMLVTQNNTASTDKISPREQKLDEKLIDDKINILPKLDNTIETFKIIGKNQSIVFDNIKIQNENFGNIQHISSTSLLPNESDMKDSSVIDQNSGFDKNNSQNISKDQIVSSQFLQIQENESLYFGEKLKPPTAKQKFINAVLQIIQNNKRKFLNLSESNFIVSNQAKDFPTPRISLNPSKSLSTLDFKFALKARKLGKLRSVSSGHYLFFRKHYQLCYVSYWNLKGTVLTKHVKFQIQSGCRSYGVRIDFDQNIFENTLENITNFKNICAFMNTVLPQLYATELDFDQNASTLIIADLNELNNYSEDEKLEFLSSQKMLSRFFKSKLFLYPTLVGWNMCFIHLLDKNLIAEIHNKLNKKRAEIMIYLKKPEFYSFTLLQAVHSKSISNDRLSWVFYDSRIRKLKNKKKSDNEHFDSLSLFPNSERSEKSQNAMLPQIKIGALLSREKNKYFYSFLFLKPIISVQEMACFNIKNLINNDSFELNVKCFDSNFYSFEYETNIPVDELLSLKGQHDSLLYILSGENSKVDAMINRINFLINKLESLQIFHHSLVFQRKSHLNLRKTHLQAMLESNESINSQFNQYINQAYQSYTNMNTLEKRKIFYGFVVFNNNHYQAKISFNFKKKKFLILLYKNFECKHYKFQSISSDEFYQFCGWLKDASLDKIWIYLSTQLDIQNTLVGKKLMFSGLLRQKEIRFHQRLSPYEIYIDILGGRTNLYINQNFEITNTYLFSFVTGLGLCYICVEAYDGSKSSKSKALKFFIFKIYPSASKTKMLKIVINGIDLENIFAITLLDFVKNKYNFFSNICSKLIYHRTMLTGRIRIPSRYIVPQLKLQIHDHHSYENIRSRRSYIDESKLKNKGNLKHNSYLAPYLHESFVLLQTIKKIKNHFCLLTVEKNKKLDYWSCKIYMPHSCRTFIFYLYPSDIRTLNLNELHVLNSITLEKKHKIKSTNKTFAEFWNTMSKYLKREQNPFVSTSISGEKCFDINIYRKIIGKTEHFDMKKSLSRLWASKPATERNYFEIYTWKLILDHLKLKKTPLDKTIVEIGGFRSTLKEILYKNPIICGKNKIASVEIFFENGRESFSPFEEINIIDNVNLVSYLFSIRIQYWNSFITENDRITLQDIINVTKFYGVFHYVKRKQNTIHSIIMSEIRLLAEFAATNIQDGIYKDLKMIDVFADRSAGDLKLNSKIKSNKLYIKNKIGGTVLYRELFSINPYQIIVIVHTAPSNDFLFYIYSSKTSKVFERKIKYNKMILVIPYLMGFLRNKKYHELGRRILKAYKNYLIVEMYLEDKLRAKSKSNMIVEQLDQGNQ